MSNENNTATIDAALTRRGKQADIAQELRWPESKVSEVKAALRKDGAVLLDNIGLKVVPRDMVCVSQQKLELLLGALRMAIPSVTVDQLLEP
jgi:short subunit dehydrogenase-like uncharacterized protein